MKPHRCRWMARLMVGGLVVCGCHSVDRSRPPPVDLPAHYRGLGGSAPLADQWWTEFGSPPLDALVQEVLDENLELHQAWARLEQALTVHRRVWAGFFPAIRADLGANTQRQNFNFGDDPFGDVPMIPGVPAIEFPENAVVTGYPLVLAASYEVDLWGRVRNANKAAIEDVAQQRNQMEAQAITLTGEVADAWFRLLEARERKDLLHSQLTLSMSYLEQVEFRFQRGLVQSSAIYQQRSQIAAQRRSGPGTELEAQLQEHRLALLLGRAPSDPIYPD